MPERAATFGSTGHGVDLSEVFLAAAHERAAELDVAGMVSFEQGDAGRYRAPGPFDVVACLGATWIGGGLAGTIELMRSAVADDGLLLIGEPYWIDEPPQAAYAALGFAPDDFASLDGTLDRFGGAGLELVEMVLADPDSWDRYVASQWWTVHEWLKANPTDPDAPAMREFADTSRRSHLAYNRRYLGWGVFALRQSRNPAPAPTPTSSAVFGVVLSHFSGSDIAAGRCGVGRRASRGKNWRRWRGSWVRRNAVT